MSTRQKNQNQLQVTHQYRLINIPLVCRALIGLLLAGAQMATAADLYVATNGAGNGSSWANATNSLQGAIDAISGAYITNTVWVSNGVYATGGRTNYPTGTLLTNRVVINKAITVRSANNDPANTIIKGAWAAAGTTNGWGAVRCVYMTNSSALIGFMLTNGATLTTNESAVINDRYGGGIHADSSTTISNCIITGNSARSYGGGMYGGYLCAVYNCAIIGNLSGLYGGGVEYTRLYNCTLTGNSSENFGGGASDSALYNCLVTGNTATTGGGTLWCGLCNCTVVGNRALNDSGGIWSSTSANCINCIVYFNHANNYPQYDNWNGPFNFTNSCTTPTNSVWAIGNITNDPIFVTNGVGYGTNHVAGNYRLRADSPCVNAGLNQSWMTNSVDLDGRTRIRYGTVDMGAYEIIYNGTIYRIP